VKVFDAEGVELKLPLVWIICDDCQGHGKSSAYLGAITQSDREQDWDDESFEHYMRGGYDKTCDRCHGSGKVEVIAYDQLSEEQKALVDDAATEEREYRAMCDMERRMGA
jgi:hypothetical protein